MVDVPYKLFERIVNSLYMANNVKDADKLYIKYTLDDLLEHVKDNTFFVIVKNNITHSITSVRFFDYIQAQNYCDQRRESEDNTASVVMQKDIANTVAEYMKR